MAYFLPLQMKNLLSNLATMEKRSGKIEYLKIQKNIVDYEIHCLKFIILNFFAYKNGLNGNCQGLVASIETYMEFAEEKVKYRVPGFILKFTKPLIIKLLLFRYLVIVKGEKIKFAKYVLDTELEINNEKGISNQQLNFQFEPSADKNVYIFKIPDPEGIKNIKLNIYFKLDDHLRGVTWVNGLLKKMGEKDAVKLLNHIKNDVDIILRSLDIDDNILWDFKMNYRLILKEKPEAIQLIVQEYIKIKNINKVKNINSEIDINTIKGSIKNLKSKFIGVNEYIEEQIKLKESKRLVKNQNDKHRNTEKVNRVLWLGTREQLLELFYLLHNNNFLSSYDESVILGRFSIIGRDNKIENDKIQYPNAKFLWLGANDDFAQLINELVESGLSPQSKKYKKFSEHFLNNEEQEFKNLSQSHYHAKNHLKANLKITNVVSKVNQLAVE